MNQLLNELTVDEAEEYLHDKTLKWRRLQLLEVARKRKRPIESYIPNMPAVR